MLSIARQIADAVPVLQTERLRLRAFTLEDFAAFAALHASPHAALMWAITEREAAWDRFLALAGEWAIRGRGMWALVDPGSDAFLGHAGYLQPVTADEPELGWALVAGAEGCGLGAEAVRTIRSWGRDRGILRPVSFIDARNHRSIRLAERLGAVEESRTVFAPTAIALQYRHPATDGGA